MFEDTHNLPTAHSFQEESGSAHLRLNAEEALANGEKMQAWYLLMAFYESQKAELEVPEQPDHPAIEALRKAWDIAIELDDPQLAEQTYKHLEEHLSFEEADACLERFQELESRRMGAFGIAMSEMGEVAAALSERLIGSVDDSAKLLDDDTNSKNAGNASEKASGKRGFARLVGFNRALEELRTRGFGVDKDPSYLAFIEQMNAQHGMEYHPSRVPLVIRADSRDDAHRLMLAISEELDVPVIRMRMDANPQGDPVLSVMTNVEPSFKNGFGIPGHNGPGVLILEDIDEWYFPTEGFQGEEYANPSLTKAAHRALSVIGGSAAHNEVTVLASVSAASPLESMMLELLEPYDVLDVYEPSEQERADIWEFLASRHNSLTTLDAVELVRLSAHMPRADIFAAAREAIEQAYREGLEARRYLPVSLANMLDKIAAYQPLDSEEFKAIERILIEELREDISRLETQGED